MGKTICCPFCEEDFYSDEAGESYGQPLDLIKSHINESKDGMSSSEFSLLLKQLKEFISEEEKYL